MHDPLTGAYCYRGGALRSRRCRDPNGHRFQGLTLAVLVLSALGSTPSPARPQPAPRLSMPEPVLPPRVWRVEAQRNDPVISVAKVIAADPAGETPLAIQVSPKEAIPQSSFIRVRGLPPAAALSEGFAITAGLWAVPLNGLSNLRIKLPAAPAGELRLTLQLVTVDGKVHAETSLALVAPHTALAKRAQPAEVPAQNAASAAQPPPVATGTPKAQPAPTVAAFETPPSAAELQRAKGLLASGREKLAQGNIAAARMFLSRAADAGLAEAAFAMAATYDPLELARRKVLGLTPDPAEARRWYERARALGAEGADERLARLGER